MTSKKSDKKRDPPAALPAMPLPQVDEVAGVLDELQAWFVARADAEGWVYTSVLRQLVNRMYRDRDYLEKRKREGRHTAYDYAVERDQKAIAWAIRALVRHVPEEDKEVPEPPKPARKPSRRLTATQKAQLTGPSWNGQPKRDWDGPDLPPTAAAATVSAASSMGYKAGRRRT